MISDRVFNSETSFLVEIRVPYLFAFPFNPKSFRLIKCAMRTNEISLPQIVVVFRQVTRDTRGMKRF